MKAIKAHGIENLYNHLDNMKNIYGMNVIVAFNRYTEDTDEEIEEVKKKVEQKGNEFSLVEGWAKGGEGAIDIAEKLTKLVETPSKLDFSYELNEDIKTKVLNVAQKVYRAKAVEYSEED
jgi:formate--tetrahydrofolate ligase